MQLRQEEICRVAFTAVKHQSAPIKLVTVSIKFNDEFVAVLKTC